MDKTNHQIVLPLQLVSDELSLEMANVLLTGKKTVLIFPLTNQALLGELSKQGLDQMASHIVQQMKGTVLLPIAGVAASLQVNFSYLRIRPLQEVPEGAAGVLGLAQDRMTGKYKNYLTSEFELVSARESLRTFWTDKYSEATWKDNPLVAVIHYVELGGIEAR